MAVVFGVMAAGGALFEALQRDEDVQFNYWPVPLEFPINYMRHRTGQCHSNCQLIICDTALASATRSAN